MNSLFLLTLIADLIKSDKPTVEQIHCVRVIVNNLIQESEKQKLESSGYITEKPHLDQEAKQAQEELTG